MKFTVYNIIIVFYIPVGSKQPPENVHYY